MNETKDIVLVLLDVATALVFYKVGGIWSALGSIAGSIFYVTVLR